MIILKKLVHAEGRKIYRSGEVLSYCLYNGKSELNCAGFDDIFCIVN
jgi:hypothetical protein